MKNSKEKKSTGFYGESSEKDAPVFLLAQALGVWGKLGPARLGITRSTLAIAVSLE